MSGLFKRIKGLMGLPDYSTGLIKNIVIDDDGNLYKKDEVSGGGSTPRNQLLNSNFDIWQRCASILTIKNRSRTSNVATVITDYEHGYQTGDEVQISNISEASYNDTNVTITVMNDTKFTYPNTGSDEVATVESDGTTLLLNRFSMSVTDKKFIADRWFALRSTGQLIVENDDGIKVKQSGSGYSGLIQVIPSRYRQGSTFSISLKAKASVGAPKVRIALLEWDGTTDAPNFTVVDTWSSDPTLNTNWSYADKSDQVTMTTDYQVISKEEITATGNNIAFAIFTESISESGSLEIKECQLIESETIADYEAPIFEYELDECQKFYQKSYDLETPPTKITETGAFKFATSYGVSNGNTIGTIQFDRMYKTPEVMFMSYKEPPYPAGDDTWVVSTGTNVNITSENDSVKSINVVNNSGFSISTSDIGGHYVAEVTSV